MNIAVDGGLIEKNRFFNSSQDHSGRFVQALGVPTASSRSFPGQKTTSDRDHYFFVVRKGYRNYDVRSSQMVN